MTDAEIKRVLAAYEKACEAGRDAIQRGIIPEIKPAPHPSVNHTFIGFLVSSAFTEDGYKEIFLDEPIKLETEVNEYVG